MSDLPIDRSLTELLDQSAWLAGLAHALVRDPHAAADATQQTWLQALHRPHPLRDARAWLATVLGNVVRQGHRGDARRKRREDAVASEHEATNEAAAAHERFEVQRAVAAAVQALAEPFRTTVLLHHFEGRSLADIARSQRVPMGTVRWRLHRAHELLRGTLAADYGNERWRASVLLLCPSARSASALLLPLLAALLVGALSVWYVAASGGPELTTAGLASAPAAADDATGTAPSPAVAAHDTPREQDAALAAAPVATNTAEQRATVRARIVDDTGAPIAGASLRLAELRLGSLHSGVEPLDGFVPPVRSGADGAVVLQMRASAELVAAIPNLPRGEIVCTATLAASADGFAETRVDVHLGNGDERQLGDVALHAVAAVTGRVLGDDGQPIAGARVCAQHPPFPQFCDSLAAQQFSPNEPNAASSAAHSGRFELAAVRTGVAIVWASKRGFVSAFRVVDVARPETAAGDFVLRPATAPAEDPGTLALRVRVVDAAGAPVANARVHYRTEQQSGMTRARKDGTAMLELWTLAHVAHKHIVVAAGDDDGRHGNVVATVKAPYDAEVRLELPPVQPLVVRAHDERGEDIASFVVVWTADAPAAGEGSARASRGTATLPVPCAAATLAIRSEGFAEARVPFVPERGNDPIDVTLAQQRGITGIVTAAGRPVAGARVSLLDCKAPVLMNGYRSEGERRGLFDAKTGPDGRFRIDREKPGALRLQVHAEGHAAALTDAHDYDSGRGWNDVAIELPAGGAIAGTVVDARGAPQPRALVAINDFFGDAVTLFTDTEGRFHCDLLRPGPYEVRLAERNIDPDSWSVVGVGSAVTGARGECEVRAGAATECRLVADGSRIHGRLAGSGFSPRGWQASLVRPHDLMPAGKPAPLAADGTFALATSGVGAHVIMLRAPGGPLGNVTVEIDVDLRTGDNEVDVPLHVAPLRGRAAGASPDAWTSLRQRGAARRVTVPVRLDPLTLDFATDFAPVGDVVLTQGTTNGSAEIARFVVAPR